MATEPESRSVPAPRRLVLTRVVGQVTQAAANEVVTPAGRRVVWPGQGGVVLGIDLGAPASGWASDHLEPGASVSHPESAVDRAFQVLACVGNRATVTSGPAAGATGVVVGKHGAVIVRFAEVDLRRIAPGDWVTIDAIGVGAVLEGEPEVAVRSCSPELLEALVHRTGERLRVEVAASFPPEAAAAGIGMPSDHLNLDLEVGVPPLDEIAGDLRFGDIVVLEDHDHTNGRLLRPGWLAIGVIAHGSSAGGGHGLGFVTLVTGPADRFDVAIVDGSNLRRLLHLEGRG